MASSVAAIGIGVGMVGAAAASLMAAISGMSAVQIAVSVVALVLVVSLPSVILTWFNLRRRDLGAILNASGWAINREMRFSMKRAQGFTNCARPSFAYGLAVAIAVVAVVVAAAVWNCRSKAAKCSGGGDVVVQQETAQEAK